MNSASVYPLHHESTVTLSVPAAVAFDYLDDFKNLSAHMEKPSAAMMGSKMTLTIDSLGGRVVGSRIRLDGRILGMTLSLEEEVTERLPPVRKAWQTVNAKLLVIGQYRLGFALSPSENGSLLRVFIDYDLPHQRFSRWLGTLFGTTYARWCTTQMTSDAVTQFNTLSA